MIKEKTTGNYILRRKKVEELQKILKEALKRKEELDEYDPFWGFVPTSGQLDSDMKKFLAEYLKPEDIPNKVDGQVDSLLCDANIIGDAGGNQSGKSVEKTISGLIKSTGELPVFLEQYRDFFQDQIDRAKRKFIRGRVVGVDFKQMSNTILPAWKQWTPKKYLKNHSWKDSFSSQHNTLTLYRGGKSCASIEFFTNQMDVESFQGPSLDWLIYDEQPREDIHKENLMRFTTADKLDISFAFTPTKGLTWATNLFSTGNLESKHKKSKIALFKLCSVTNPKANLGVLREILDQETDYDVKRMRLLGEFVSLSGLIYGSIFRRSVHVIKPFPLDYNKHFVVRGLDPHLAKPTVCVEVAFDRAEFEYVVGTYVSRRGADTEVIKYDLSERAKTRGYRLGWTRCDKSVDYKIEIVGINVFQELQRGKKAIPALEVSEKFQGSIHTGVDAIKKALKEKDFKVADKVIKLPTLFIFDIPENETLINSFHTLERDTFANEDKKGERDTIAEGKHDAHACLRYIHQRPLRWYPPMEKVPEYIPDSELIAY